MQDKRPRSVVSRASILALATLGLGLTPPQDPEPVVGDAPEPVAREAEIPAERNTAIVPWAHVHRWFAEGRFDAIGQAFEQAAEPDHWLREYGRVLASRGKHAELLAYFNEHHFTLSLSLRAGVDQELALQRTLVRIGSLDARGPEVWQELVSLFENVDPADPVGRVRSTAFLQLVRTAADGQLQAYLEEALPDVMTAHVRGAASVHDRAAGALYTSQRRWRHEFIRAYISEEKPGWRHFIDCAWRHRKRVSPEWLAQLTPPSEAVALHVGRTLDRIERYAQPARQTH